MQGFTRTVYIPSLVSVTTTGNIDNLDFSGADLIRMNNATDSTIRGLVAGSPGQRVTIVSIGAGNVYLAHQNTNSTAANRLINNATSGNTPLAAGIGQATYIYDGTTARWRLVQHEQGAVITVAHSAGNFTASAGNWTVDLGDQVAFNYLIQGKFMIMTVDIDNTDVSATPTKLQITIPGGFTAARGADQVGLGQNASSTVITIRVVVNSGDSFVGYVLLSGSWSTTSSDNTRVIGQVRFEVT